MTRKLSALKALYTALGGSSDTAATLTSEIGAWNAILALGEIEGKKFISDAIASVAENFALIDPSPAATLIEKTVTANGTYNATSDSANGYSSVTVNVATPVPETYAVAINVPESGDPTINHTYAEIASAFNSGKSIIGEVNYYGYEQPLNIVYSFKDDIRYTATGTDVVLTDAIVLQTNCFDIVGQNMPSAFLTFIVAQYQGTDGILLVMNMFAN